jgi:uncharacterized Tic20 family protein
MVPENSLPPLLDPLQPSPVQPLSAQDERTWAMLAHLSTVMNLFTGFLGIIIALIIYLIYKERSRYVAYQSLQSFLMQLIGFLGGGVIVGIIWAITGILSAVIVGICLIPLAILISLIPLAAVVYGIVGGIRCTSGEDFRYWLIGDWVRSSYTGAMPQQPL